MVQRSSHVIPTSLALVLSLVTIVSTSSPVLAQSLRFNSPSIGAPGNREAGAARSATCAESDRGMVALLPDTNLGLTTEAYPTFFVYLPPTTAQTAEFMLYQEQTNNLIYRASFHITGESGIASIKLPKHSGQIPLQVGERYYWYFTIVCDPADRSADITVQGNVERVTPGPDLVTQIQAADPREQAVLYAAAGIWHEALSTLVNLTRSAPDDSSVKTEFDTLLREVGLEAIADEPLL